ncbi:two-component regulator propeller domain-containing protein, partial [bacterium]
INKFDQRKQNFSLYQHDPEHLNSLNNNTVLAIHQDRSGIFWIGTKGGGLNRFNPKTQQFSFLKNRIGITNSLSNNVVRAVCEDHLGFIWIATEIGLNQYNPGNGAFTRYLPDPQDPASISFHNVWQLLVDQSGNLWIGTLSGGLDRFDRKENKFIHYRHDPNNSNSISDDFIWSLHEDQSGILWIGTDIGGLNRFDTKQSQFTHYRHDPNEKLSLSNDKVLCIHESQSGILWFGTANGLNKYNNNTGTFHSYLEKDGLSNNNVQAILEDDHGNLWISTNHGLSKFNPQTETFQNYNKSDGLQSNEFCPNACFKSKNGELVFGGIHGFNIFHPDSVRDNPYVPPVIITNFEIFNQPVPITEDHPSSILTKSITETDAITLSYRERVISFEFAALNFSSPKNNQYAYKLIGFDAKDSEWNYTDASRRFVTYTNLNPGKYHFIVKGSNNDGIWNETGASIRMNISPPFWLTWWFRLFGLIFLTVLIYGVIEYRIYGIKKHREKLEALVEERTQNLKTANQELEAQKKQIQQHALALKNSNEDLEQFAYIASHDLREPLRTVNAYVTLLAQHNEGKLDSESQKFIHSALKGTIRMHDLIVGLLNYSRITTQAQQFGKVNCQKIIEDITSGLHVMIDESKTKITFTSLPIVTADKSQLEQLFQNLIMNAITYSKNKPIIHISAEKKTNHWQFAVKDNGIGIDHKYFKSIFGIFHRLHGRDEYSGTGIGLAICKRIVERHDGQIWVESMEGKGSTFYFTIPSE